MACKSCPLHRVGHGPVPWRGPIHPIAVVIGEAPGEVEDKEGRPFCGPSGDLAEELLVTAGFTLAELEQIAWMNVVSCFPNRTPMQSEVQACDLTFQTQFAYLLPEKSLLFGGVASSKFVPGTRIGEIRGRWINLFNSANLNSLSTWHPSAILRSGGLRGPRGQESLNDITRFHDVVVGEASPELDPTCIKCGQWGGEFPNENGIAYCRRHYPGGYPEYHLPRPVGGGQRKTTRRPIATHPTLPHLL